VPLYSNTAGVFPIVHAMIERILTYGVMSTPVLVVDGKIVMTGHRGAYKIEAALKTVAGQDDMTDKA